MVTNFFEIHIGDDSYEKHSYGIHYISGIILRSFCIINSFDFNNPMDTVILFLYFIYEETVTESFENLVKFTQLGRYGVTIQTRSIIYL